MKSIKLIVLALIFSLPVMASHIRIDTLYSKQWNPAKESWDDFKRTIVKINGDLVISEIVQIPVKKNHWENYSMRVYAYNHTNQLVQVLDRYWRSGMEIWEDNYLMLYEYNSEGLVESLTHTNIYNTKPFLSSREFYTYNDADLITEKVVQHYDRNSWANFLKVTYNRPSNERLASEDNYYWNGSSWGNIHSTTRYIYGSDGEMQYREKDVYIAGIPVTKRQDAMKYDAEGMLATVTGYVLDEETLGMYPDHRMNFAYNSDRETYSRECQLWIDGTWENYVSCISPSDVPRLFEKQISEDMSVCILPGDVKNTITVAFENFNHEKFRVKLLNCYGGEICNETTEGNEVVINTRDLDEAEYFIEIQGSSLYSGKLILD